MRLSSPLIFDLARSVDVEGLAAGERSIEVPAAILPSVFLPLAQSPTVVFSVTDPQRTSFFQHSTLIRTNQVEVTQNICAFGRGLWWIRIQVWYKANFDAFTAAGNGMRVIMEDETGAGRNLVQMEPVIADPQIVAFEFPSLMVADGWSLVHNVFTTGVGQTSHSKVGVQAVKLL